jgi:hypothetical protein
VQSEHEEVSVACRCFDRQHLRGVTDLDAQLRLIGNAGALERRNPSNKPALSVGDTVLPVGDMHNRDIGWIAGKLQCPRQGPVGAFREVMADEDTAGSLCDRHHRMWLCYFTS